MVVVVVGEKRTMGTFSDVSDVFGHFRTFRTFSDVSDVFGRFGRFRTFRTFSEEASSHRGRAAPHGGQRRLRIDLKIHPTHAGIPQAHHGVAEVPWRAQGSRRRPLVGPKSHLPLSLSLSLSLSLYGIYIYIYIYIFKKKINK